MKKKTKRILLILAAVAMLIFIGMKVFIYMTEQSLGQLKTLEISEIDLAMIEDGEYIGAYSAFPIAVETLVTVRGHRIESIEILKHDNGQGTPAEAITADIIKAQSLQVDSVTGATYSSIVILKSVEKALTDGE